MVREINHPTSSFRWGVANEIINLVSPVLHSFAIILNLWQLTLTMELCKADIAVLFKPSPKHNGTQFSELRQIS